MGGRKTFASNTVLTAADVQDFLMDQSVMVFTNAAARGSAIPSPTEGMVSYLTASDSLEPFNGSSWVSAAGVSSGNAILNGAFEINQRNFTSSTVSATFGFDRWRTSQSGGTVTYSAETFVPGSAPVASFEGTNFARLVTAGQSDAGHLAQLTQLIEGVRTFAGQTVTVSFWARAGSGTPKIAIELSQVFGAGGSPELPNLLSQVTLSTSFQRFSATITLPSISGKTIFGGNALRLNLWVSAGSNFNARLNSLGIQNNTFDLWGVQVEAGSVANPFRRNANSIEGELAACQRYYFRATTDGGFKTFGFGQCTSATAGLVQVPFPVEMRIPPFALEQSGTAVDYSVTSASGAGLSLNAVPTFGNATKNGALVNFTTASGLVAGNATRLLDGNVTTAFLGWSAEV